MATHSNAAAAAQARAQQNAQFMSLSYPQTARAFAQNGTQFTPGQPINFDAPVLPGAWLERIVLSVALTVTYTPAATNPTAPLLTAGGIWNVLNTVAVKFGEQQISIHPYFAHVMNQMRGYNRPDVTNVPGDQNAAVQDMLYKAPTLNSGDNNWAFDIDIPLNSVHPNSVNGLLPLGQTGTKVQIQAVPATQFVGNDPLNNVVYGTNGTIAVTGTVTATVVYRDFHSYATLQQIQPDLTGLATVQVIKPSEINPLTGGGVMQFRSITNPYPMVSALSIAIDGKSPGTFCAPSNVSAFELDQAENTNTSFWKYDDTTGGFDRFLYETRRTYGRDFDSGVLPWFNAPVQNVSNPSSLGGNAFLDLTSAGYPAARLGIGVNSVDSSTYNIVPRLVTFIKILNPQGISLV